MRLIILAALLLAGLSGGFLAAWVGLPLPFMMGGLFAALPIVVAFSERGKTVYFPQSMRRFFIAMIGALIGGTVTPDLISVAGGMFVSMAVMFVFVPLVHGASYLIGRRVGKFDPVTAVFAAMPGGLIEAVEMGTRSGGDTTILILNHLLRVVLVVVLVPIGFFIWSGDVVGSSSGHSLADGAWNVMDVVHVVGLAIFGLIVGSVLRLPAAHLVGPLIVSALAHGAGWVTTSSPDWVLFLSQLVVGVGLAAQFTGTTLATFGRVLLTVVCQIAAIGVIGGALALSAAHLSGLPVAAMILSFAPGGVSEMGLIALSLTLSPVIVTAHHVLRLFLAVSFAGIAAKWMAAGGWQSK